MNPFAKMSVGMEEWIIKEENSTLDRGIKLAMDSG